MTYLLVALLCLEFAYGQKRVDSLFVFVGEKIKIDKLEPKLAENQILFDEAFKAKYKVVQRVYGHYKPDTIDFDVYDCPCPLW